MECTGKYVPTRKEARKAKQPYKDEGHDLHWHRKLQEFFCYNCDLSFKLNGTVVRTADGVWIDG